MDTIQLRKTVVEKLMKVIDPETGTDVIRMRLVQDLSIDENGKVTYTFRPSSPLCPIAVPLALMIIQAVEEVPGVSSQSITVLDYIQADQLNEILKSILEE
ncbi:MAG TPA: iron-sulfur cluster assembly protein [Anaerolineaceae bacterium]|jgi:metal-sulfur cluster biosynthetic enzyme|nr:iron-sulfur cluster assembly protein [Anaerolineaceae bacterium]HPA34514.1 iron-sulfur cluster assembly protein [Anaerolineaceae bacterium]HQP62251.1 iron-sulfur cluster assembly protein [Anaerolineaceae bacterium]